MRQRSAAVRSLDRPSPAHPHRVFAIGVYAALAVGCGVIAAYWSEVQRPVLLASLGVVISLPVVVRAWQARWDPFEPIMLFALGLFVLFFLRPVAQLWAGESVYLGLDSEPGFDGTLVVVLVATAGVYLGYGLPTGGNLARRARPLRDDWHPADLGLVVVGLMLLGLMLFAVFVAQVGFGAIPSIFGGRASPGARVDVFGANSGYFFLGPYVSIPATFLLLEAWHRGRSAVLGTGLVLTGTLALALTVPRGDRGYLLALLLPLVALFYLRRGRRPRVAALVATILASVLLLNFFLGFRNYSTRPNASGGPLASRVLDPVGGLKYFMLGPDTSMFAVLSLTYQVVPEELDFVPGREIAATLAAPLGRFWESKPRPGYVLAYRHIFPAQAALTEAGFTSGLLGGLYVDSGFVGAFAYMLLYGIATRALWEYSRRNPDNASIRLLFVSALPMIVMLLRNGTTETVARAGFLVAPVVVACWFAARLARRRVHR